MILLKRLLIFPFIVLLINPVTAQHAYSTDDSGITVFYPADFDSIGNMPSFALLAEPVITGPSSATLSIIPEFYVNASGKKCARIAYDGDADLYGTGEGVGTLRRNGADIILWNTDNYNYTTDNGRRLYQSHPWILGVRSSGTAFGILIDNTWKQEIKLNNPIDIISEGPSFRVLVIEKASPQEVVKALAQLTGKIEMPPLWALGYQQSRYSYYPDTKIKQVADNFRSKHIPCDVIWMDIDYMQDYKIFTFNNARFPDPQGLNSYLHTSKFKSVWMIDPGVKKQAGYPVYDGGTNGNHWVQNAAGQEYNGNVWPGSCAFPDFTRPETQTWWSSLYNSFMPLGIDGIWNDMNEPSVFNGPGGTMPVTNRHRGGGSLPAGTHLRYHNVYGMLMVRASRDGILNANPAKRPFVLSRSNFLGGQRYAATWTGDNASTMEHLKLSIPMSLNLGLSGQPFSGADIGGYSGNVNSDLLANWMAVGAFYPFCRNHTSSGTANQEPWAQGAVSEAASRIALQRRYALLPYLYTLFHEASVTGMPVMRPVFFADEKDISLRREQSAFMWGKDLLIVPKFAVNPALPKGTWKTMSIVGEDSRTDNYQPDILQRGGSIIPLGKIIESTADYSTDSITLLIALDSFKHAAGTLYTDAGEGFGYRNGDYLVTNFTADSLTADTIKVVSSYGDGTMVQPGRVIRGGLVTANGTFYSDWTTDSSFKIFIPQELSLTLVSPVTGSAFAAGDSVSIQVDDHSQAAVIKVEFYADTIKIGENLQPPYRFNWLNVATGIYTLSAKAHAASGLSFTTNAVKIMVGNFGEGKILWQFWDTLQGAAVADLTNSSRFPYYPNRAESRNSFAGPVNIGDQYGSRLVGYIHPPKTGDYQFWISGDDYCSFNLSTDTTETNKRKIAEVPGWTNPEEWDKYPAQRSAVIHLEAGKKYFAEALHKEASGGDNLAVSWQYFNQSREIIPGVFLSPYIPKAPPVIDSPVTNAPAQFAVYPNPAKNSINVILPGNMDGAVCVIDVAGRILARKTFVPGTEQLSFDVRGYSAGIYFIRINTSAGMKLKRILVTR